MSTSHDQPPDYPVRLTCRRTTDFDPFSGYHELLEIEAFNFSDGEVTVRGFGLDITMMTSDEWHDLEPATLDPEVRLPLRLRPADAVKGVIHLDSLAEDVGTRVGEFVNWVAYVDVAGYGSRTLEIEDRVGAAAGGPFFAEGIDPNLAGRWTGWGIEHRDLLREVFRGFEASGDWPEMRQLQRDLERRDIDIDVPQLFWEIPRELGFREGDRAVLTPQGLRFVEDAQELLAAYFAALELAYARYRGDEATPTLHAADLRDALKLPQERSIRVAQLLLRYGPGLGSGSGDARGNWHREITDQIRVVRGTTSAVGLLDAVASRRWPATPQTPPPEPMEPLQAQPKLGRARRAWRWLANWTGRRSAEITVRDQIVVAVGGGVLVLLVVAAVGFVSGFLDGDSRPEPPVDGVSVTVNPNPAERDPKFISISPVSFWFPGSLAAVGRPPGPATKPWVSCRMWRPWALAKGAYEADTTFVELIVQAHAGSAVVIDGMDVSVQRRPVERGVRVICPSGGAEPNRRRIFIDLDREPPRVRYAGIEQRPGRSPLQFTLEQTETEILELAAYTKRCRCTWRGRLHLIIDGQRTTIPIDDGGAAFRTAAPGSSKSYLWGSAGWRRYRLD